MEDFVDRADILLHALLAREALPNNGICVCGTKNQAIWRCKDCTSPALMCHSCMRHSHAASPLHHIECWTGVKIKLQADVGHICHRDSVVGSQSRGQARRRGRPRSDISNEEREREMRWAQNGTEQVNGVLFDCLTTYTGMSYILWASRRPCGTYKAGRWLCSPLDSELGTRSSSR